MVSVPVWYSHQAVLPMRPPHENYRSLDTLETTIKKENRSACRNCILIVSR